ncbi:MAG: 2-phospho-L-lactate transferase [Xanthobacteraceae bacterium]|nr:2-phospho-L-lactate transferase [Xanthobacteraceae bacterium]
MSDDSGKRDGAGRVVALCGGVGGAKLALGLQANLGVRLTVIVNMADDFNHLGLHISPDLDTVLYTLSGLNDTARGWGRAGETWNFMAALQQVGGDTWFQLGDRDLALHVERTRRRALGETPTTIAADIAKRLGVTARILPATDADLRTMVTTPEGELEFQRYFVARRCEPTVKRIHFEGRENAMATDDVRQALAADDLELIVICPSNPYLSIDPILAVRGIADGLRAARAPVVAVSPIIGGEAVKGPTRKIMDELGLAPTNAEIVAHYRGLIDGLVIDRADGAEAASLGTEVCVAATLMTDLPSKIRLAEQVLAFGRRIRGARAGETIAVASGDGA